MNTKLERVDFLIRFLIYSKKLSYNNYKKDLSEGMKTHYVTISRALSGDESYLTDNFIEKLNNTFGNPFNLDWLLNGEGECYNNQQVGNIENSVAVGVNVFGSNNSFQVPESIVKVITNYDERMKNQQKQMDKLLVIIENLSKYEK